MHFTKMHGAGNDFIIINNIDGAIPESVLPGTQLSQLRTVYSHQQAIAQSETFLKLMHLH